MARAGRATSLVCSIILVIHAVPATAKTHLTPAIASVVARNADMRAVLAEGESVDAAILAQDEKGFSDKATPEKMVNSPNNRVLSEAQAEKAFRLGFINYKSIDYTIDYITIRPPGKLCGWAPRS